MNDHGASATVTGVTSWAYHITMWILVAAGILANLSVLVWRCSRRESRLNLLSIVIVSLALADLCFCCHCLLQEVVLAEAVFGGGNWNSTLNVTTTNKRLCVSITFLTYVSSNLIMLMAVAIALYSLLLFHRGRWGSYLIASFVVLSWVACVVFGVVAAWEFKQYNSYPDTDIDLETFSLIIVYGCVNSYSVSRFTFCPIVDTTLNAISSLLITFIYICLWRVMRKNSINSSHSTSQEINRLSVRLAVISGLNVLCWWPACVLYWITVAKRESVYKGSVSPVVSEPILIFVTATCVANPIIYTIASKPFFAKVRRACACCVYCRCRHGESTLLLGSDDPTTEIDSGHCALCCRLLPCQPWPYKERRHLETLTDDTDETGLFTETIEY